MKQDEYIETLIIKDKLVNVGLDDYGQQYFFEYYDNDAKELKEVGCGAYNLNYKQEIEDYFLSKEEIIFNQLADHRKELINLQNQIDDLKEILKF